MKTFETFADPEVWESLNAAKKTGEILCRWEKFLQDYEEHMKTDYGIPICEAGSAFAPFDMIGDTLRGTTDILMDMYDHADELMELINVMLDFAIKDQIASATNKNVPYVWFWLHKGVDSFMSNELFEKFYWPSLRQYIIALTEAGLVPVIYAEGTFNNRLKYFTEIPEKKVIFDFEYVDMLQAKKILGGHSCIAGNVPASLLSYGTVQEVTDYCKWLIDTCAPGGGFILDTATIVDDAKVENMEAMFEVAFTYGKRYE
jgi:uroporphyrinogen-III decarboxylase